MGGVITDLEQFQKEIESDAYKYATNIAKNIAKQIANDMYEETSSAIERFYKDWDPEDPTNHNGHVYYYRHWNFKKSYKKYYKDRNPYFIGGVYLLPQNIPDVYTGKRSAPEDVFRRVYLGYHGIASFQPTNPKVPIMAPSPIRIINDKFKEIEKNIGAYESKAAKLARKDNYIRLFRR